MANVSKLIFGASDSSGELGTFTVSDEALEKAAGGIGWAPMLTGVATICVREAVAVTRRPGSSSK
jgi:hypothetical protein